MFIEIQRKLHFIYNQRHHYLMFTREKNGKKDGKIFVVSLA